MIFEPWARLLVIGHAALAIALAGSSTHLALSAVRALASGSVPARLLRSHGRTTGILYVAAFALGLLAYPSYRYHVRGLYLDRYAPGVSNLFDMKENLAALALPLALVLFGLCRRLEARVVPVVLPVLTVLALLLWGTVVFSTLSGLWVTCVKGV